MKYTFFIIGLTLMMSACVHHQESPITITEVSQGAIEGFQEDGLGIFRGIPYAEPPIGKLRWHEPIPAKSWQGTFKATSYAPIPPQQAFQTDGNSPEISEDCLYLNVVTPAISKKEKLPVMVWIHGGGFINGNTFTPNMNYFAKQGIVCVSIEYRLGVIGFLSLPELSKESEHHVSGNYGLQDQILALRWVNDNIDSFGGDPSRITIIGESAGAISVSMLCASPLAKGLFHRAISESGGNFCPVDSVRTGNNSISNLQGAESLGKRFMNSLGVSTLEELRNIDAMQLVSSPMGSTMGTFWPIVDGFVLLGDQYELYEQGNYNDVDVLIGTNSDEGSVFAMPMPMTQYQTMIHKQYGPFALQMLHAYPANSDEETTQALANIFRETAFAWPTYAWERLQTKTGKGKVYAFYFDHGVQHPFYPERKTAWHTAEIPFAFNTLEGEYLEDEQTLAKIMSAYWINFIKTGNPNGSGLPEWPVFEEDKPTVMSFNKEASLIDVPNKEQLQVIDDFYRWKREQPKDIE